VPQFEQAVKDEILADKVRALVTGSAVISDAEIRQEFEKQNSKVKFSYALFRKDDILKEINPTDLELRAFYDRNKAGYNNSIPEKRKLRYVLIDTVRIEAQTPITPDDLQGYYRQHREEFRVPEQVNVRHILFKIPPPGAYGKVDQKAADAARKKADDVSRQLKAGGDFAELAKKYSEDTDTAKNGGSLGWIQRGRFPAPAVEQAAFSLPKGAVSDVINAGYAFDIIKVDDKQDAHLKSPDEVKEQMTAALRQSKGSQAALAEAREVLSQARTIGLDKAAAAKGLQIVSTDFVSRTDSLPGLGASPQFMAAVFSQRDKSPADEVQLARGDVIFEVTAIKPPATPTYDEIRGRVETEFKNERESSLLSQKTRELSDRAKTEHSLEKAAKELGATLKTSDFVSPDGQVPDIGSMTGPASVAFTLKPGEISGPLTLGNAGAVLAVIEKQEPPAGDFAAKKDQIRDSLLQAKQGELFGLFVASLRDRMEKSRQIKINQEEMKNLTRATGGANQGE
ncbi:MAG: peptidyl-prolyl cis-trans isomerase, partial [Acidobacteriales bacterium]|nr:peptidyl-prolyl cis-trans isomerase [Terriglobales bacterium]